MTRAVGFTGTRRGMTERQAAIVRGFLVMEHDKGATEFHHGDCVGADEQAAVMALEIGYEIHVHPSTLNTHRAHTELRMTTRTHPVATPIKRNHDIVEASQRMICAPAEPTEKLRSGTWATIRYAKKIGVETTVVTP